MLKLVGFAISIRLNYWDNYGFDMLNYADYYFRTNILSLCDFALIQILCSYPKYSHQLSIDNILKYTYVYGSYDKLSLFLVKNENELELN